MPPPPAPNRARVDRFVWHRHYFWDRTPLARVRFLLVLAAVVVPLVWAAASFVLPARVAHSQLTHGTLTSPHQAWENECEACHRPRSTAEFGFGSVASADSVHKRWNDLTCENCHSGKGSTIVEVRNYAPHHVSAKPELACASCHHDHQGRDFSLTRVGDSDCTQCHQDLKNHHEKSTPAFANAVTNFDKDHPEFKGAKTDFKRTLKFSHQHHMTPGIPYTQAAIDNKTNGAWKLDRIPPEFREFYRQPGEKDDALVSLSCSSCHQLDAGRVDKDAAPAERQAWLAAEALAKNLPLDAVLPPRAEGAYYLPINYDVHCQACHAMPSFDMALRPDRPDLTVKLPKLPHRVQPKELLPQTRRDVVSQLLQESEKKAKNDLMGRLDPLGERKLNDFNTEVDGLVSKIEKELYSPSNPNSHGSCSQCHKTEGTITATAIVKPSTPALWYPHAKFNHARHRAMKCAECHPGQTGNIFDANGIADRVLVVKYSAELPANIPGIDNCRQCHAPASVNANSEPRGGVRFDCVECHRYHNGERPLQGLGAAQRDPPPARRLGTGEFLRGLGTKDTP